MMSKGVLLVIFSLIALIIAAPISTDNSAAVHSDIHHPHDDVEVFLNSYADPSVPQVRGAMDYLKILKLGAKKDERQEKQEKSSITSILYKLILNLLQKLFSFAVKS